jgi:Ca2+-transporting ATPase
MMALKDCLRQIVKLVATGVAGIALSMCLMRVLGFMQRLFGTTSLNAKQWLLCAGFAIRLILVDEVIKFFLRRRDQAKRGSKNR